MEDNNKSEEKSEFVENNTDENIEDKTTDSIEKDEVMDENQTDENQTDENQIDENIQNDNNSDLDNENNQVEELKKQNEDLENQFKRLLAEFDNFRKRTEKEKTLLIDVGASNIISKILPIVDNLDRAIENIPEDLKENSFVVGVDNIYKQILKIFEEIGVKPIKTKGEKFDPNLHNAVLMDEESDEEEGTITEELQKGWIYKENVIRHSMVKVKK